MRIQLNHYPAKARTPMGMSSISVHYLILTYYKSIPYSLTRSAFGDLLRRKQKPCEVKKWKCLNNLPNRYTSERALSCTCGPGREGCMYSTPIALRHCSGNMHGAHDLVQSENYRLLSKGCIAVRLCLKYAFTTVYRCFGFRSAASHIMSRTHSSYGRSRRLYI